MNLTEIQLKQIKTFYYDIMNIQNRKKLDRYTAIVKQFIKLQNAQLDVISPPLSKQTIAKPFLNEVKNFKRKIENTYKLNLSDYESFLWKNQKLGIKNYPDLFKLLTINTQKKESPQNLLDINFPILNCKVSTLCTYSVDILNRFSYSKNYSEEILTELVRNIATQYNIVGYHNFSHAFSVQLQMFQCFTKVSDFKNKITQFEKFFASIAALSHDLNHPGTNSYFEIKKKSDLAMKYNFNSVMQNMHIAHFFRILRQNPKNDIISALKSPVQRQKAKRLITKLILATDMAKHGEKIANFTERVNQTLKNGKNKFNFESTEDREEIMEQVFHSCDIGNSCLDFPNYLNWSVLLSYQFNKQAQMEQYQMLPVTQYFRLTSIRNFYCGQIGFLSNFVLPTWKQLFIIWPQVQQFYQNIQKNIKILKEKAQEQGQNK